MSVDLRYVNPKISLFVDPGGPTQTERFQSAVSFIKINCYQRLLYEVAEHNPADWWCLTLLQ